MNGAALYILLTNILGGEEIDQTFALALFNIARLDIETRRPWQGLKAKDTSLVALGGTNLTTAYSMPSPATPALATPYLMEYLRDGSLKLVSGINLNNTLTLKEIPFENQLDYQGGNFFYSDYANRKFYILANLPAAYTIYQFFIADFGDITTTTNWVGFLSRFTPALAFQAAARYRLGTDYDDIAARNADQNFQTSEAIVKSAIMWDARISQQVANNRSMGAKYGGNDSGLYPPPGGPYGNYGA